MHAIEIENLAKTYAGGVEALRGISLSVEQGDFFALLGPNGAGKSTIIGILTSLVTKSSGRVHIFGHNIDTNFSAAKALIGVVPQEFNFNFFEKVEQILLYQAGYYGLTRKTAKMRTQKYLEKLELWDKRNVSARELSGGMKRRLMIARALLHQPKMLILDEPTAGVDIEIRRSMWAFLTQLNADGTTIILTTHYLEEAESLCRNIAIIDQGRILENTSMKNMIAKLHCETFVMNLASPLTETLVLDKFPIQQKDDSTLEVMIEKSQDLNTLFKAFDQHNIKVLSMRNKSNRLEELFVRLVQKKEPSNASA